MTTKIKILIWVLVIGIVLILIGGWLTGYLQDLLFGHPFPIKEQIIIFTNKTEYKQGELVNITVRNDLNRSIWYADFGCYPWWKLEKQEGENWQSIEVLLPTLTEYGEKCIACPPPQSIEEVLKELKPNSEVNMVWNLKNCKGSIPVFINKGNYKLSFTYGLSKGNFTEKTIYSNEFTVKGKEIFLEEKGCQRDEDCKGTCDWDCINKDYLPKKYTCESIPSCWCVNNQCIHIPNREGHQGMLQIIFSPKVMLGKNPIETKEKISRFIISTNLGIDIIGDVDDLNIIRSITIYSKGINVDLIEKIKNDPLVKDFKEWAYLPETLYHKAGSTYLIEFGEGLYREDLQKFVTKYPKIKDNLVRDYWDYTTYPLQPIFVAVNVPVGEEDKFVAELKIRYQSEILEVEMLPFE